MYILKIREPPDWRCMLYTGKKFIDILKEKRKLLKNTNENRALTKS